MKETDKRMSITLTPWLRQRLERLKQDKYYNKSYAEMVRDLIESSLDADRPTPTNKTA